MHQTPPTDACGISDKALRASPCAPYESNPKNPKGDQPTRQGLHLSTVDHHCVGFHPWLKIQAARWLISTSARRDVGLEKVRVHDLRHTFGQRLRDGGVSEEDRALLLGHAIEGMPQHYATATVARLVKAANSVSRTRDRTTLLRVVNG